MDRPPRTEARAAGAGWIRPVTAIAPPAARTRRRAAPQSARFTERQLLDLLHARYSAARVLPGTDVAGARRYVVAEHVPDHPMQPTRIVDFLAQDVFSQHLGPDGRPVRQRVAIGVHSPKAYMVADAGRDVRALHGHEIKVSRGDWLRELQDPSKSAAWSRYCDRWWLVAPPGVARREELPAGWGLMEVTGAALRVTVQAPRLHPEPMPIDVRVCHLRAIQTTATRSTTTNGR